MNWDQLRTMLWLRWRLTRNQWGRGGGLNTAITMIAFGLGLILAVAGGMGGVAVGALALGQAESRVLQWIWDGLVGTFLFFWLIGIVSEVQRSEIIDLSRLIHLPMSLRDAFLLNYLASHLSLSLIIFVPTTLGLSLGLALGRGPILLLLVPALLGFFFMISAWTYCLRGWLVSLMVNQRRRRAIIWGVTLGVVALVQLPNLVFNVWLGRGRSNRGHGSQAVSAVSKQNLEAAGALAHRVVPFLWLPGAAKALAEGQVGPAFLATVGTAALGMLGLARAYRSTLSFYRGVNEIAPVRAGPTPSGVGTVRRLLVERSLPMVPEEAAAMALANLRSMMRAPEVKMALVLNVFVFGIMGAGLFAGGSLKVPDQARVFLAPAAVAITFLGMIQVLFNQFGFDRDGFRALVLLPASRRDILLGKNLSLLPIAATAFVVILALVTALAALPPIAIAAACLQFIGGFCFLSAAGNLASILAPYRIASGSLKPNKTKATTTLLIVVITLLFPLTLVPLLIPAAFGLLCEHLGWHPLVPVHLGASLLLAALAALGYWLALEPLGRLLQRREQGILQVVTQEVE